MWHLNLTNLIRKWRRNFVVMKMARLVIIYSGVADVMMDYYSRSL